MFTTLFTTVRFNRIPGRTLSAGLLFGVVLLLTGCSGQLDPNATPIIMFPTSIPKGSALPTFISFATPNGATSVPTVIGVNPTAIPATAKPSPVPPTVIPTLDNNWTPIANGVEYRRLAFRDSHSQDVGILVARIDPTKVTFRVGYTPNQRKSIQDWLFALPGAVLIVNANYFDQTGNPIGLVASSGQIYGASTGRADSGMFQVRGNEVKGRSLFLEPYSNTERFDQLVQGFPLLMASGQVAPAFDRSLNDTPSRRTVIAQDVHGRILVIVTPLGATSFTDMANFLGLSGLEINNALNMDGGTSTCLYMQTGGPSSVTSGLVPVPVVLAVYPK